LRRGRPRRRLVARPRTADPARRRQHARHRRLRPDRTDARGQGAGARDDDRRPPSAPAGGGAAGGRSRAGVSRRACGAVRLRQPGRPGVGALAASVSAPGAKPLEGRTALVTGAGRGIGRATAVLLAADGARVLGVSRTVAELESLAADTGADWIAADLAAPADCARIVEEAQRRLGWIDILVNNAGIGSAGEKPVWLQDPARWRQAMALNLDAPFE